MVGIFVARDMRGSLSSSRAGRTQAGPYTILIDFGSRDGFVKDNVGTGASRLKGIVVAQG